MNAERNLQPAGAVYGINAVKAAIGVRPIDYVLVAGRSSTRVRKWSPPAARQDLAPFLAARGTRTRAGTSHHQDVVAVCAAKHTMTSNRL